MPTVILAFNYWLHLLATVTWLGGMAILVLMSWPGQPRALTAYAGTADKLFDQAEHRIRPLTNLSLIVLLVTGLIQMGGDPHYEGFLQIDSPWSVSLLVKHMIVAGIIGVSGLLQWGIYPALNRAQLLADRPSAGGEVVEDALRRRYQRLVFTNLVLGVIVLLATAFLTAL